MKSMNMTEIRRKPMIIAAVAGLATTAVALIGCEDRDESEPDVVPTSRNDAPTATPPQAQADADDDAERDAPRQEARATASEQAPAGMETRSSNGTQEVRMVFAGAGGQDGLRVTRTAPEQVRVGEPFTYEVTVENVSELAAHNIVVRETLPEDMYIRADIGQRSQQEGSASGAESYRIGMIPPGGSESFTVDGIAQSQGEAMVCLAVDFDQTMCSPLAVVQPELRLERLVMTDGPAYVCEDIEVRYVLTNIGSGETSEAVIMEQLPEGFEYEGQPRVQLNAGTLAAGESYEETVVISAQQPGRFSGQATARAGEMSVQSRQSEAIEVYKPEIDVRIDGPSQHYVGWPATYRIIVENTSDAPALETVLNLPEMDNLDRVSISPGRMVQDDGTIAIGRLDPGESQVIEAKLMIEDPQDLSIIATANAYCATAVEDQLSTSFEGIAALRLETIDLRDPVPVGEETTYEIRVKNQGSAESVNVRLTAELPEEMEFVRGRGDSQISADGNQITFEPLTRLGPGELATWRIQARATSTGDVSLKLKMESDSQKTVQEEEPTNLFDPRGR